MVKQMNYVEVNFDGLVGPLHNYAGLSAGNLASRANQSKTSSPRKAALQGLDKMAFVRDLGIPQAFFPPHRRPAWKMLERLGYAGAKKEVLRRVGEEAPHLLASSCSSSAMWSANVATVCPGQDCKSGKLSIVIANLTSHLHRSIEPATSLDLGRRIFREGVVYPALPATPHLYDEGAANHLRLCPSHSDKGLHVFVYGSDTFDQASARPTKFPSRQTKAACEAVVRLLEIPDDQVLYLQQSSKAIDAGVFHNDVISTGNNKLLLYHEYAFEDKTAVEQIRARYIDLFAEELVAIEVAQHKVSLQQAVTSYLFNSQLLTLSSGAMLLLAPTECEESKEVALFIETLLAEAKTPLEQVHYMNLRESMCNGGGPACLRLRVVMNEQEESAIAPGVWFTEEREQQLRDWVNNYYPESITPAELVDLTLHQEVKAAFDALEEIVGFSLPES